MDLQDKLIDFFNDNVKVYDAGLLMSEAVDFQPITKEEYTPRVVDQLLGILEDYKEKS